MDNIIDRVINGRIFKGVVAFACGGRLRVVSNTLPRRNSAPALNQDEGPGSWENPNRAVSETSLVDEPMLNSSPPLSAPGKAPHPPLESLHIGLAVEEAARHLPRIASPSTGPLPRARFLDVVTLRDTDGEDISAITLTENLIWQWNQIFHAEAKLARCNAEIDQAERQEQEINTMLAEIESELHHAEETQTGNPAQITHELNVGRELRQECEQQKAAWIDSRQETAQQLEERRRDLTRDMKGLMSRKNLLSDPASEQDFASPIYKPPLPIAAPTPSEAARISAQEARDEALDLVRRQRLRLRDAQLKHDNWPDFYEHELMRYKADVEEGKALATRTEFDLELLAEQRAAAADLTDAEKGLEAVVEYTRELGAVFGGSDIESGFLDHVDDGYRLSLEDDMIRHVDRARIEKWMAERDDKPNHSTDCDDWDSRTVELYDSVSVVAGGKDKARIEKWRKLCEENKVSIPPELREIEDSE